MVSRGRTVLGSFYLSPGAVEQVVRARIPRRRRALRSLLQRRKRGEDGVARGVPEAARWPPMSVTHKASGGSGGPHNSEHGAAGSKAGVRGRAIWAARGRKRRWARMGTVGPGKFPSLFLFILSFIFCFLL